eukprot:CAMPEP_0172520070 /NCGR_PEP_ID=MMETSP1066-20121228/291787_1 /TAXON_ID=671091 /ORGANISM="Coscinodiscus wailesii, Strain CCMP2513" /LENGTH=421 /DNA_ID=CAMNT_0013302763 /DNA_START=48 /DNA_END=1313 /DNA_ORIENTATION=+
MPTRYMSWRNDAAKKTESYEEGDLSALAELVPGLVDPETNKPQSRGLTKVNSNAKEIMPPSVREEDKKEPDRKADSCDDNDTADVQWLPVDPIKSTATDPHELKFIGSTLAIKDDLSLATPAKNPNIASNEPSHPIESLPVSTPIEKHEVSLTEYNQIKDKCLDLKQETKSAESSVTTMRGNDNEHNIDALEDISQSPTPPPADVDTPAKRTPSTEIPALRSFPPTTQNSSKITPARIPLHLPNFKPATGCTNASDFIVRCFVARLRAGMTVVKHGRSRWCKSRLRTLNILADAQTLTWKPAVGEPPSSKRPPKLDLSLCREVRHAWSSDPLNPMFTGTSILRLKCEAANAHKSFALIFPKRTVDITAITADQCKVLMEGFSALCYRLQAANGDSGGGGRGKDEDEYTTASATYGDYGGSV